MQWARRGTQFQSTQPKRAATVYPYTQQAANLSISIHAAQEGCDFSRQLNPYIAKEFQSTQPKRAATSLKMGRLVLKKFQSTQPKRAATIHRQSSQLTFAYFNPRSPRGLRLSTPTSVLYASVFQSTQPKRVATSLSEVSTFTNRISIHAAQEGCDTFALIHAPLFLDFNPRSPRGLRQRFICAGRL